jgi:hypothetical protein
MVAYATSSGPLPGPVQSWQGFKVERVHGDGGSSRAAVWAEGRAVLR